MKNIQFSVKLSEEEYLKLAFLANKRVVGVGTLGRMIIHNYLNYPAQLDELRTIALSELIAFHPKKRSADLIDKNRMEIKDTDSSL